MLYCNPWFSIVPQTPAYPIAMALEAIPECWGAGRSHPFPAVLQAQALSPIPALEPLWLQGTAQGSPSQ